MRTGGSAIEVLAVATRLGLTSFGGPTAHVGYFRREYVERRGWLDDVAFADLVALCQSLPGPASSQLGYAIGVRRAGLLGGVAAWVGFTGPSALAMILVGLWFRSVDLSQAGWVHGLKLAAVAVVAQAVLVLAGRLAPDWPRRMITLVALAIALAWQVPFAQVAIIVVGGLAGWLILRPAEASEAPPGPSVISRRVGLVALGLFVGLLAGLPLLRAVGGQTVALVDAFYRSGALVFGGGHVVLALLQAGVVDPGWVTPDQFVSGYGAAQAIPGPLFTFAGYLGAVSVVPPNGVPGGLIAIGAIFLPGLLLVTAALPSWDRFRAATGARRILSGTNAAVVGILAAALYTPVWTSAVTGVADVAVAFAGFGLLMTNRVPPIVVVGLAAVAGQLMAG